MMPVDAVVYLALLPALAGIESGQERNSGDFFLAGFVFVLEAARVTLGARASEIVVVAQLAAVPSFLDAIQS